MKKLKILLLALAATISVGAWAEEWTDVTSTYLKNAGFDDANNMQTGNLTPNPSTKKSVTEWEFVGSNDWVASGCIAYGSDGQINGSKIPSTNSNGETTGGALTITGAWDDGSGMARYTQKVTLPAGKYKAEFVVNNVGQNSNFRLSYFGFTSSAKNFYGRNNSFPVNTWTTESVEFTITEETTGKISVGFGWSHAGSANTPKLVVDLVKLYVDNSTPITQETDYSDKISNTWTNQTATYATDYSEHYEDQHFTGETMSQTISELPTGFYSTEVSVNAHCADWNCKAISEAAGQIDRTILYVNDVPLGIPIVNNRSFVEGEPRTYLLRKVYVDNGTLKYLIKNEKEGANWITAKINNLIYLGNGPELYKPLLLKEIEVAQAIEGKMYINYRDDLDTKLQNAQSIYNDESATVDAINQQINALQSAIANAKVSIADYAKLKDAIDNYYYPIDPDYDDLESIIAEAKDHYEKADLESCSDCIASLSMSSEEVKAAMVNDYMYVTGTTETPGNYIYGVSLGEWTTTGYVSTFNNEHWSGTTHDYKNQDDSNGRGWNSPTGFTIGLNQNVTLPAGNYIFKACGRKSGDAVLELVVKNGDVVLGRVANFPSSNNAKGIDKSGVTSFSGDNFANSGKGFGWQWRYVAFTLAEETTINVAVSANATSGQQWVSFGDYTIQTDDEANLAMIGYNIALNDAKLALDNDAYNNVTGAELTALNTAIAFETAGKTKEQIEEATTALQNATTAFIAAAPEYDAFVAILEKVENLDDAGKAKFSELEGTVISAYNDHTVKAADLDVYDSYIAAVKAQTTPNKDWSDLIKNNSFEEGNVNGWTNSGSVDLGALSTNPANNPKVGNWFVEKWGKAGSVDFNQTISDLPAGYYKVTVRARNEADAATYLYANDEKIAFVKNNTDEYSTNVVIAKTGDLKIGVSCENHPENTWLAVDNFTLTYLGTVFDATMTKVGDAAYSSMYLDFPVEIPENVEAYYVTVSGKTATMNPIVGVIPANCGVILKAAENVDKITFTQTSTEATTDVSNNVLIGFVKDTEVEDGKAHYAFSYKTGDTKPAFYIPESAESDTDPTSKFTAKAHKAYIELESAPNSKLDITWGGEATGINTIDNGQLTIDNSKAYNLNGMRVNPSTGSGQGYKGIVLKGGKKFLQK